MKKPSRLSYAYAVGRIRVLEKYLIEQAVFREAAEEKDLSSALKVIFDAGNFSDEWIQIKDSDELDGYIEKEEEGISHLMEEILLDKDLLRIFLEDDNPVKVMHDAERIGYSFVQDYIRHRIDLSNLKILFRMKYSGLSRDKFERLILPGGFLGKKLIAQCFDLSFAEVGEKLRATQYKELLAKAADTLEERDTFIELERGIEDFLMTFLKKAKNIVFGPEPVFAYGLAKKREMKLVRLLGVGKANQIPAELLKERMSQTYV
jgi:V/A-type H+-transporting ATPase subunit C